MLLVPVDVAMISWPLLTVVMTVTNSWSDVDTRSLVLTTAEVLVDVGARVVEAGRSEVVGADDGLFVGEAGACEVGAGASEVGSVVGSAGDVEGSVEGAGGDDGGGRDVGEGGADVGEAPVPLACRFSPWCR